ncbi:hypothetical protein CAEBREN_05584 [Caenorhabditis brenneri]|uniref:BRK domain-containing protein n=1 Tax=Caenorhabditis brenneri TaxID=135651 RepID=G0NFM6_CAEBE|nr:hypothetical protein CAEBREN_05584 [Caenorhabditis brenneri]
MTIKDFVLHPMQQIRDTTRITLINQGYPAYSFLDQQPIKKDLETRYSTITESNGTHAIGFVRAAWDQKFVADPRCLKSAQLNLQHIFQHHPKIMKVLEKGLPPNLISVTWAENGFDCGGPEPRFTLASGNEPESRITYKKLSPNVQICQYTDPSNIKFLAGVTYYMEPAGQARYFESDTALIHLARCGAEQWPLLDRSTRKPQTYGRYCNKAGKEVVVDCTGENGGPIRHMEYDHAKEKWMYKECEECLVESLNYKFETFRSYRNAESSSGEKKKSERRATPYIFSSSSNLGRLLRSPIQTTKELKAIKKISRGFPTTIDPFVPKIMSQINTFERITSPDGVATIGIARAPEGPQIIDPKSLEMIKDFVLSVYPEFKDFDVKKSRNAIAISFALRNFQVGYRFYEFNLIPEFKPAEDGYFQYQRLSPNVQVTYYIEGGIQFLAGICYFPVLNGKALLLGSDKALMTIMEYVGILYPFKAEEAFRNGRECYGRKCEKSGRRVVVGKTQDGRVRHLRYDHWSRQWEHKYCEECIVDWYTGGVKKEEAKEVEEEDPNELRTPNSGSISDSQNLHNLFLQIQKEEAERRQKQFRYYRLRKTETQPIDMPVRPPPDLEGKEEKTDEQEELPPKSSEVLKLTVWEESKFIPFSREVTKPLSVAIDIPEEVCEYAYKPPGSTFIFDVRNGEIIDTEDSGTGKVAKKDKKKSEVKSSRQLQSESLSPRVSSVSNEVILRKVPEVDESSTTCIMENPAVSNNLSAECTIWEPNSDHVEATVTSKVLEIPEVPKISVACTLENPAVSNNSSTECTIWETNSDHIEATVTSKSTSTCLQVLPQDFPNTLDTKDPVTELRSIVDRLKDTPITDGEAKELLTRIVETLDATVVARSQGFMPQDVAPEPPTQRSGGLEPITREQESGGIVPQDIAPEAPAPEPSKDGMLTLRIPVSPVARDPPLVDTAPDHEAPVAPTVVPGTPFSENLSTETPTATESITVELELEGSGTMTDYKSEHIDADQHGSSDPCCSIALPLPVLSSESSSRASSSLSLESEYETNDYCLSVKSVAVESEEEEIDFEEIQDPQAAQISAPQSDEEYDIIEHDQ